MNILAIDTSTKYLCLAIAKDDKLVAGMRKPFGSELSEKIIPSIDAALKQSKLSLKAIDYFGIGLGPGSFTGLRIGLAVIKGLVFPFRKPVIGVGSLDVLARAVSNYSGLGYSVANHGPLASGLGYSVAHPALPAGRHGALAGGLACCPIVDARRSLVYAAVYNCGRGELIRKTGYLLASIEELLERLKSGEGMVFLGDGLNLYSEEIKNKFGAGIIFADDGFWYPKPEALMSSVKEKIKNKDFSDLHKLVPIYLYPKDCQVRK